MSHVRERAGIWKMYPVRHESELHVCFLHVRMRACSERFNFPRRAKSKKKLQPKTCQTFTNREQHIQLSPIASFFISLLVLTVVADEQQLLNIKMFVW